MGTLSAPAADYTGGNFAIGPDVEDDLKAIIAEFNGSIEAVNIALNAVGSSEIAANAVGASELATGAVRQVNADYTSTNSGLEVWQSGPTFVGSANGGRIVRCSHTFTSTTGAGGGWEAAAAAIGPLNFSDICVDGSPAFANTPKMLGMPVVTANAGANVDIPTIIAVNTISATQIKFDIFFPGGQTADFEFTLEWGVAGDI